MALGTLILKDTLGSNRDLWRTESGSGDRGVLRKDSLTDFSATSVYLSGQREDLTELRKPSKEGFPPQIKISHE